MPGTSTACAAGDIAAAASAAATAAANDGAGPKRSGARSGVTLAQLVQAGVVQPGQNVITVSYKGASYAASLNAAGAIEYEGSTFVRCASACDAHDGQQAAPAVWPDASGPRLSVALSLNSDCAGIFHTFEVVPHLRPVAICMPSSPPLPLPVTPHPHPTPRSPTAFSIHVKRKQTPGKAGDDGWVSVHYLGRPLSEYRQGQRQPFPCLPPQPPCAASPGLLPQGRLMRISCLPCLPVHAGSACAQRPARSSVWVPGRGVQACTRPMRRKEYVERGGSRVGSGRQQQGAAGPATAAAPAAAAPAPAPRSGPGRSSRGRQRRKSSRYSESDDDGAAAGAMEVDGLFSTEGGPSPLKVDGDLVVDLPPGVEASWPFRHCSACCRLCRHAAALRPDC